MLQVVRYLAEQQEAIPLPLDNQADLEENMKPHSDDEFKTFHKNFDDDRKHRCKRLNPALSGFLRIFF